MGVLSTASKLRTFFSHLEEKLHSHEENSRPHSELIGKWTVYQPNQQKAVPLEITPEGDGRFDDQPLKGEITHSSSDQLVIKDRYGYRLTIQKQENNHFVLLDELGEEKYPIEKVERGV